MLQGAIRNDTISGGGGNDIIVAGDGNDTVDAGVGNDRVDGGNGNDRIIGGNGNDDDVDDGVIVEHAGAGAVVPQSTKPPQSPKSITDGLILDCDTS